jgi:5-methylthioadenosine/S-adenosylhomocysteine deaminase
MTMYEADWICPVSSPPIRNGAIAVENATVAAVYDRRQSQSVGSSEVHEAQAQQRAVSEIDRRYSGCAIIPGFVNAHTHIELTILRGFLEDLPFSEWIPKLTRAKYQRLTRDDMLASARLGCLEMVRAGVTCLGGMNLDCRASLIRKFLAPPKVN